MVLPFADCPPPLGECGTVRDRPLACRHRLAGFARVARLLAGADWPGSPASPADVDDFT